jgi:hypothetical protein
MTRPRRWRWWGKWTAALILFVVVGAWAASGSYGIGWYWTSPGRVTSITIGVGEFGVSRIVENPRTGNIPEDAPWPGRGQVLKAPGARRWIGEFAWDKTGAPYPPAWTVRIAAVPMWLPAVCAILATVLLFRLDRRPPPNSCPRCRYNLSGTPPSAPCPECGRAQPSPNAQVAEPAARTTP